MTTIPGYTVHLGQTCRRLHRFKSLEYISRWFVKTAYVYRHIFTVKDNEKPIIKCIIRYITFR